jgi:hypothetical protein
LHRLRSVRAPGWPRASPTCATSRLVYQQVGLPAATAMPVNLLLPPDPILPATDCRAPRAILGTRASAARPDFYGRRIGDSPSEVRLPGGFALNLMLRPGLILDYDMMVMMVCGRDLLGRAGDGGCRIRNKARHCCRGRLLFRKWLRGTRWPAQDDRAAHAIGAKSERMGRSRWCCRGRGFRVGRWRRPKWGHLMAVPWARSRRGGTRADRGFRSRDWCNCLGAP